MRNFFALARLRALLALVLLAPLAACASLDGQAVAVLDASAVQQVANAYPPQPALETFYGKADDEAGQRAYRDQVIGAYLAAADIRYLQFRRDLSREMKGSSLALDIAVLGLTGGASLASESTANALSAGAAGLAGSRASLSKELWFDKALPALIAAMDARRTEIRTQILGRMRGSPSAYSLAEAFSDIARYQEAATLDSAIGVVTAAANERSVEADQRYAGLVLTYSGAPPEGLADRMADMKAQLEGELNAATPAQIANAAAAAGVTAQANSGDTIADIMAEMAGQPDAASVDAYVAKVSAALKGGN